MQQTITQTMLKEHARLDKILLETESQLETDIEESEKLFSIFCWNLDKHFFIEEKVIFHVYNEATDQESSTLINLLQQHKDMQWLMNKLRKSFKFNASQNLIELKKNLRSHVSIENEIFYPKLDNELDEKSKDLIFERFEEIVG